MDISAILERIKDQLEQAKTRRFTGKISVQINLSQGSPSKPRLTVDTEL